MSKKTGKPTCRNLVAKFSVRLLRAAKFRDRTKYRRQAKHKGREPFPLQVVFSL